MFVIIRTNINEHANLASKNLPFYVFPTLCLRLSSVNQPLPSAQALICLDPNPVTNQNTT